MDSEINQLEERAKRMLDEYRMLREEHGALLARADRLESENRHLQDKLTHAIARIEALIARLPEQDEVA